MSPTPSSERSSATSRRTVRRWPACRGLGARVAAPPDEVDADTERYRLYGAVVGILEEASRDRPVVLVLDDVQWADAASLQLLRHVVKMGDALGLLIICTYRDTELSSVLVETLGTLRRERGSIASP